jgi:hypothetical protein
MNNIRGNPSDSRSGSTATDDVYLHFLLQSQGSDALYQYNLDRLNASGSSHTVNVPRRPSLDIRHGGPWRQEPDFGSSYEYLDIPGYRQLDNSQDNLNTAPSNLDHPLEFPRPLDVEIGPLSRSEKEKGYAVYNVSLLLLATAAVALTGLYASGAIRSILSVKLFSASSSYSLFVLRVLSEVCTIVLGALSVTVIGNLQWALASRLNGIDLIRFLSLDAGTGLWSLLQLLVVSRWKNKPSSFGRYVALILYFCCPPSSDKA